MFVFFINCHIAKKACLCFSGWLISLSIIVFSLSFEETIESSVLSILRNEKEIKLA